MKRLAFRLITLLAAVAAAGLVSELGLRVAGYAPSHVNPLRAFHQADPVIGHRGRPDYRGRFKRAEFDVEVAHDSRGFRLHEWRNPQAPLDRRVLVYGDSFVWGWGVGQGQVFTDRLGQLLPDREVVNFGIVGAGTAIQVALFESEELDTVGPGDTVVLMFVSNDFDDNVKPRRLHGEIVDGQVKTVRAAAGFDKQVYSWFKEHSYLTNLVAYLSDNRRLRRRRHQAALQAPELAAPPAGESPKVVVTLHYLRRFRDLCRERGVELLVVYVPEHLEVVAEPFEAADFPFRVALRRCADQLDLDVLDPLADFRRAFRADATPLHIANDGHWSAAGHRQIAETLAAHLKGDRSIFAARRGSAWRKK